MEELNGPSASLDLRQEFENWRRANRINLRHWVVAEKMGGHAMRYVRWERGMVMLRGIHIEIAHVKLKTRAALV